MKKIIITLAVIGLLYGYLYKTSDCYKKHKRHSVLYR
nr:MAG TPA: foot protein [Caudoviricetes sp.]